MFCRLFARTGRAAARVVTRIALLEDVCSLTILLLAFEQISGNMATEHVNGNGTEEPMDTSAAVTHSEHFQTLLDAGLPQKVAEKLDEIYVAGKLWNLQSLPRFWDISLACAVFGLTEQLYVVPRVTRTAVLTKCGGFLWTFFFLVIGVLVCHDVPQRAV